MKKYVTFCQVLRDLRKYDIDGLDSREVSEPR